MCLCVCGRGETVSLEFRRRCVQRTGGRPGIKRLASAASAKYAETSVAYVACVFPPLLVCCSLTMDGAALAGVCRSLEEQRRYRLLRE